MAITTTPHILWLTPALGLCPGPGLLSLGVGWGTQWSQLHHRSGGFRPLLAFCVSMEQLVGINVLAVAPVGLKPDERYSGARGELHIGDLPGVPAPVQIAGDDIPIT